MGIADSQPVNKVRKALRDAGLDDRVVELDRPAAEDTAAAAKALECDPGAVALTRMLAIGPRMVMALWAGDHKLLEANLGAAFFLEGEVRQPQEAEVRGLTGFNADCVPPVGFTHPLPTVMDRSLKRFKHVYASAGDPQCVFRTTVGDLKRLTGAIVSWNIAEPIEGEVAAPPMRRTKTFTGERKIDGLDLEETA